MDHQHGLPHTANRLGVLAAFLVCHSTAHGLGVRIPAQDAEGVARGNAFAATADNPSAVYYNPAGLTQLEGQQARFGVWSIALDSTFRSPAGSETSTEFEIIPVPQFFYTHSLEKKPISFGLGLFAPFGLGVQWPDEVVFRPLALESRLTYLTIEPVAAWKVTPSLSIAAGPTFNMAQLALKQGIVAPGDKFRFKGWDFDVGYNVALRWQPAEKIAFGVNYRSQTTMDFNGTSHASPYADKESSSFRMPFPQFVTIGVSYRPDSNWNLEANVDWTDWDRLDQTTLTKASGNIPVKFNWTSSYIYEAGITRFLPGGWFVSGGYFFTEVSTSEADFTPLVPDTDFHAGSLGFGRRGAQWSWAVAYQLMKGPERSINNGSPAAGTFQFFNQAFVASLGYRF